MTTEASDRVQQPSSARDPETYARLIEDAFSRVDINNDRTLSRPEIKDFLEIPDLEPNVREAFTHLRDNFDTMASLYNPTIVHNEPPVFNRRDLERLRQASAPAVGETSYVTNNVMEKAAAFGGLFAVAGLPFGGLPALGTGAIGLVTGGVLGLGQGWSNAQNRAALERMNYFRFRRSL